MRSALVLFVYAVALAWAVPGPLARLTARGISPRLGLAAWLTAMASALALGAVALIAALTVALLAWRYGRTVQRAQSRSRAPAEAARIDPPCGTRRARHGLALVTVILPLVLVSGFLTTFAGSLAAHTGIMA